MFAVIISILIVLVIIIVVAAAVVLTLRSSQDGKDAQAAQAAQADQAANDAQADQADQDDKAAQAAQKAQAIQAANDAYTAQGDHALLAARAAWAAMAAQASRDSQAYLDPTKKVVWQRFNDIKLVHGDIPAPRKSTSDGRVTFAGDTNSASQCQTWCEQNPKCLGYTHVGNTGNEWANQCYLLMSHTYKFVSDKNHQSGWKYYV